MVFCRCYLKDGLSPKISVRAQLITKGFRSLTYDSFLLIFLPDKHDTRHVYYGTEVTNSFKVCCGYGCTLRRPMLILINL